MRAVRRPIEVPSENLERASRFYCDAIGFELRRRGMGFVDLEARSSRVRLVLSTCHPTPNLVRIRVDDVATTYASVRSRGGAVLRPPDDGEIETLAIVRDTEANVVLLYQPRT